MRYIGVQVPSSNYKIASILVALPIVLSVLSCQTAEEGSKPRLESADHHLHIGTEVAARNLDLLRELLEGWNPEEGEPTTASTAADAIAALDRAEIQGGVVLSNAYMFGIPDIEVEDELDKVKAENEYVASQVALFPDRLVGLCSVNPLREYALAEIERCSADPRIAGLKLHLANSDVDLFNEEHVGQLAAVFRRLGELHMPALVHMRTRNLEYGAPDADVFIEQVLSLAPHLHVQIAHMAGWGGYDDGTDAALEAFIEAFVDGRLDRDRYTFDLAAVVFSPDAAGDDEARADQIEAANSSLAERMRELGLDRVVWATDWPAWPPVEDVSTGIEKYLELVRSALPLTEDELEQVLHNVGEIFD